MSKNSLERVTIRKANQKDINALAGLLKELFEREPDFTFNQRLQRQGLSLFLEDKDTRCLLLAESRGETVGMCTAQLLVSTAEGALSALIEDVVVTQNSRRNGIGEILLAEIERWAVSKGATRLQLMADRDNTPALSFYKKMNWHSTRLVGLHKK